MVSGLTGEGLARLFDVIDQVIPFDAVETVRFRIPLRDGAAIALLHERGRVRAEDYDGNLCEMEVDAPESLRRRLGRYLVRNSTRSVENSVNK
jgi:50S ribosomal subunit-associated GTPase HflX